MNTRILPTRVQSREIKLAKYVLSAFGLEADTVGDITLDGKFALIQSHPDPELYLCPLRGNPQPDLSLVWFYADCIAFDHEIPTIISPTLSNMRDIRFRYIYHGSNEERKISSHNLNTGESKIIYRKSRKAEEQAKLYFGEQLERILNEIREFHHGPFTSIGFRHNGWDGRHDLPYSQAYASASQEMHLYATALRQADPFSEYLSYYRVIESATNSNGLTWITSAVSRLQKHSFDNIQIAMIDERESRNLLAIFRRRALIRLRTLQKIYPTPDTLANYFYYNNRCGIAHGRKILRSDITLSYIDMIRDTYVIKLLARMAIDEKLGASRLG